MPAKTSEEKPSGPQPFNLQPMVFTLVTIIAALLIALPMLPSSIANLNYLLEGDKPRVFWYLSRAAGFIALTILWVSMVIGLTITNKLAKLWPGAPAAFALHETASLAGLGFAIYHALVLMGDHYTDFSLPRLMLPFSISYATLWVGLGQLCFYLWLVVAVSFYIRQRIGNKLWRLIHFVNFATYAMGILHGIFTGSDSSTPWAFWYYWLSAGSLIGLIEYRIYRSMTNEKKAAAAKQPAPAAAEPAPVVRPEPVVRPAPVIEPAPAMEPFPAAFPQPAFAQLANPMPNVAALTLPRGTSTRKAVFSLTPTERKTTPFPVRVSG